MEAVHGYFSLSYANILVLPRSLLQSMPEEWQEKFVQLMEEYDEHWDGLPRGFEPPAYRVQPTNEAGVLESWDTYGIPHYNRGRTRVTPDGTVLYGGRR